MPHSDAQITAQMIADALARVMDANTLALMEHLATHTSFHRGLTASPDCVNFLTSSFGCFYIQVPYLKTKQRNWHVLMDLITLLCELETENSLMLAFTLLSCLIHDQPGWPAVGYYGFCDLRDSDRLEIILRATNAADVAHGDVDRMAKNLEYFTAIQAINQIKNR